VLQALQRGHENIQSEFEGFQTAGGDDRYYLANRLIREVELHVTVAAEVLYPAVLARIEQQSDRKAVTVMRALWKEHQALQTFLARVNECRTHDDGFVGQIEGLMERVQRILIWSSVICFPSLKRFSGNRDSCVCGRGSTSDAKSWIIVWRPDAGARPEYARPREE